MAIVHRVVSIDLSKVVDAKGRSNKALAKCLSETFDRYFGRMGIDINQFDGVTFIAADVARGGDPQRLIKECPALPNPYNRPGFGANVWTEGNQCVKGFISVGKKSTESELRAIIASGRPPARQAVVKTKMTTALETADTPQFIASHIAATDEAPAAPVAEQTPIIQPAQEIPMEETVVLERTIEEINAERQRIEGEILELEASASSCKEQIAGYEEIIAEARAKQEDLKSSLENTETKISLKKDELASHVVSEEVAAGIRKMYEEALALAKKAGIKL